MFVPCLDHVRVFVDCSTFLPQLVDELGAQRCPILFLLVVYKLSPGICCILWSQSGLAFKVYARSRADQ